MSVRGREVEGDWLQITLQTVTDKSLPARRSPHSEREKTMEAPWEGVGVFEVKKPVGLWLGLHPKKTGSEARQARISAERTVFFIFFPHSTQGYSPIS